jgi:hypothetical protein
VVGIDISIEKEELRQALVLSAECEVAEIRVEEIGASKGGLGAAYVKCSVAGTRKLAQAGKVALGWSTARVIAIPKRPLQCYKCLELGHVRATCVSTVERGHLCYMCGRSGHRARKCLASTSKCPLCESLGAPANHRMGVTACTPPKTRRTIKKRIPFRESATTEGIQGCSATAVAAEETTSAAAATKERFPTTTRTTGRRDALFSRRSRSRKPGPGWNWSSRSNPTRGGGLTDWSRRN